MTFSNKQVHPFSLFAILAGQNLAVANSPLSSQLARLQRRARQEEASANALDRLQRCEENLREARADYPAAISEQGAATAGCFADCTFVKRSSAEAWIKAAREEGFEAGRRAPKKAISDQGEDDQDLTNDRDDPNDKGDDDEWETDDDGKRRKKKAKEPAGGSEGDEEPAERFDEASAALRSLDTVELFPGRVFPVSGHERAVRATAEAVVLAGRVRRGEAVSPSLQPKGNDPVAQTARQILNAGCARRGEKERF
jgi:hypothetical protein